MPLRCYTLTIHHISICSLGEELFCAKEPPNDPCVLERNVYSAGGWRGLQISIRFHWLMALLSSSIFADFLSTYTINYRERSFEVFSSNCGFVISPFISISFCFLYSEILLWVHMHLGLLHLLCELALLSLCNVVFLVQ